MVGDPNALLAPQPSARFNGEIEDALGAVITTATVQIFPNGSWNKRKAIEIAVDAAGRICGLYCKLQGASY
jgi:hypothetical protein